MDWEDEVAAGAADTEATETEPKTALAVPDGRARGRGSAGLELATTKASRAANRSPVTNAILREITPEEVAQAYREALTATRTVRIRGEAWEEPDHATRLRAADAITNRTDGMPIARTEVTGADGGPVTLAALLVDDARDTV